MINEDIHRAPVVGIEFVRVLDDLITEITGDVEVGAARNVVCIDGVADDNESGNLVLDEHAFEAEVDEAGSGIGPEGGGGDEAESKGGGGGGERWKGGGRGISS